MLGLFDSVDTHLLRARELNKVRLYRVNSMIVCGVWTIHDCPTFIEALELLTLYSMTSINTGAGQKMKPLSRNAKNTHLREH